MYAEWVDLERAKLEKFAHLGKKNFGVFGRRSLPVVLADAETKYAHLSDREIETHRWTHGHCVGSAY